MITVSLRRAFRFFMRHAGGIVGECAKGALQLARAEQWAEDNGYQFVWHYEDEPADLGDHEYWCKNAKDVERLSQSEMREYNISDCAHEAFWCQMVNEDGDTVQSLVMILDPDDNYRRVVQAELALEAMPAEACHTSAYSYGVNAS